MPSSLELLSADCCHKVQRRARPVLHRTAWTTRPTGLHRRDVRRARRTPPGPATSQQHRDAAFAGRHCDVCAWRVHRGRALVRRLYDPHVQPEQCSRCVELDAPPPGCLSMYQRPRIPPVGGGLMSYGPSHRPASWRKRGKLRRQRILGGAKPGELPIEQPTTVRSGHQPENRQGDRPDDPAFAAAACRRDDPMRRRAWLLATGSATLQTLAGVSPALAQTTREPRRIGMLTVADKASFAGQLQAFSRRAAPAWPRRRPRHRDRHPATPPPASPGLPALPPNLRRKAQGDRRLRAGGHPGRTCRHGGRADRGAARGTSSPQAWRRSWGARPAGSPGSAFSGRR